MTQEEVTRMVRDSAHHVFATMLGRSLVDQEPYERTSAPCPADGVLALIGFAGSWSGSGAFSCPATLAKSISAALLMQEFAAIDSEVLDAIGEVANMILGNVKTQLEEKLGPMGLSVPTVIHGHNFVARSLGQASWIVIPFECMGETLHVQLCLAPNPQHKATGTSGPGSPAVFSLVR
jgi:chemotaxis protein CheX